MLILRIRFIVILSLVYLCLVLLLYNYLWNKHSLERGLSLLEFTHHSAPHDKDVYDTLVDTVVFSFKRRNGFFEDNNSSNMSSFSGNDSITPSNSRGLNQATMFSVSELPLPSKCIHAFYYMWYGNPAMDGKYYHWNHHYLPHWKPAIAKRYPRGGHIPPDDIGASFYPELGCYSSRDPEVIETHMYQLRKAGVGVVSVSWYPKGKGDDEGFPPDPLVPLLLDMAQMYSIKVTIHIEPYEGRSPRTVKDDLKYIMEKYSNHPAFYKHKHDGNRVVPELPLIYVYDSYISKPSEWAEVLKPGMPSTIRGTELDCVVIGLLVDRTHQQSILEGGFDGFYTYFASNGFCYGSSTINWRTLAEFAKTNGLIFIPSVGPGYDDARVRPWNQITKKPRENGGYYREMSRVATRTRVSPGGQRAGIISVTSFNEWHEGTQIESAVPKVNSGYTYSNYAPNQPDFYLKVTREIANNLQCSL